MWRGRTEKRMKLVGVPSWANTCKVGGPTGILEGKDLVGFYTCTPSITGSEGRECKLQEPVAQNQSSKKELQMLPGTELRNEKRGL